jgi:hypothetical protein
MNRSIAVLLLVAFGSPAQEAAHESADVRVLVTTTLGGDVGNSLVVLRSNGRRQEYRRTGTDVVFERLPFGLYDIEIQAAGFSTRREKLAVHQARLAYWFGLFVSPMHSGKRSEVVGSLSPELGKPEDLWIRLVPLFSSDFIEGQARSGGDFRFAEVAPGRYVILVFNKEEFILARSLVHKGGTFTVRLEPERKP